MSRSIILALEVPASASDTYQTITTQQGLASFWTPDVTAASEVGATLRFGFEEAPVDLMMTVTGLVTERRVDWACEGPWPQWGGTRISWQIEPGEKGGSRVLFRHDGWSEDQPDAEFGAVSLVWAKVLLALEEHLRTGSAVPALR